MSCLSTKSITEHVSNFKKRKIDEEKLIFNNYNAIYLPLLTEIESSLVNTLLNSSSHLAKEISKIKFSSPVENIYNTHEYAFIAYDCYVNYYARSCKQVFFCGMNPGPFGMVQSGIPFGDIPSVLNYLRLPLEQNMFNIPYNTHPKRPVMGLNCHRREVSGTRFWNFAKKYFGEASKFFENCFVYNYCPVAFVEKSGKNLTPAQLPAHQKKLLFYECDKTLIQYVSTLKPRILIGIGHFAWERLSEISKQLLFSVKVIEILHPSPINPKANRDWEGQVRSILQLHDILST